MLCSKTDCQTIDLSWINNEKIKFSVIKTQTEIISKDSISGGAYLIKPEITYKQFEELKKISQDRWISLLNNSQTDWAANICLYYLHKKNAAIFIIIRNRKDWIIASKEEDLDYWQGVLKGKQNNK